jgi:hypothetical protein
MFIFPSISRHVLWGSPYSDNVPGSLIIGLEREQWIQTNPLHSSRDSHTHCSAQFNRGTALDNRVASDPRAAVWSSGGIVDKGHE